MPVYKFSNKDWLSALMAILLALFAVTALAEPAKFAPVVPDHALVFPKDYGAHPDFRLEWWYVTGWLETPDKKSWGFQITFFRSATSHHPDNPSQFSPRQLIIAHVALSDPAAGKLMHAEKVAREGFDLVYARQTDTDVKLDGWYFVRLEDGRYQLDMQADNFGLQLSLTPTQDMILQGDNGFSRKGPKPEQASYYYSEPHLQVAGVVTRQGKPVSVTGSAWLDHEWSSEILDAQAAGWDWVGINLQDGSSLMAFQIRNKEGDKFWAYGTLRDAAGRVTQFTPEQIEFTPLRTWRSPHTDAVYPVAMRIRTDKTEWQVTPLLDDQELDSRRSIGAVYWEGAVTVTRDNEIAGRGYLELTGYVKPLDM